jgi:hypothetical protein
MYVSTAERADTNNFARILASLPNVCLKKKPGFRRAFYNRRNPYGFVIESNLLGYDEQESIVLGIDPALVVQGRRRVSRANGQVLEDVP